MRIWKAVVGFSHRVAYATVLAGATWYLSMVPFDQCPLGRRFQTALCYTLDFPVAVVSCATPWKAIDFFFEVGRYGHNAPYYEWILPHLKVAIPTYVVLFYVPNVVLWAVRRFKKRRTKDGPPPAASENMGP